MTKHAKSPAMKPSCEYRGHKVGTVAIGDSTVPVFHCDRYMMHCTLSRQAENDEGLMLVCERCPARKGIFDDG